MIYFNKYKGIVIVVSIFLSFSLMTLGWVDIENHSLYARCPNGSHKSPSGDCEQVVKSNTKLPRCPNGSHRSPDGNCESVNGSIQGDNSSTDKPNHANHPKKEKNNNSNNNERGINEQPQYKFINPSNTDNNTTTIDTTSSTNLQIGQCDESLWNHVYHPERLQIIDRCKTVSGVIDSIKTEVDGDYHISLILDPQFSNLINSANVNGQFGDMIVEPICQQPITQLDALSGCSNFHQVIDIPEVGSHVNVTGSYVLDNQHGGWAEIHPVTSMLKIQ
ncbi:MAG: hypothetical protein M3Z01_05010 [Thermoproteota archaeon]|nr:hypothetical protein [Thermoproteota archaeon]